MNKKEFAREMTHHKNKFFLPLLPPEHIVRTVLLKYKDSYLSHRIVDSGRRPGLTKLVLILLFVENCLYFLVWMRTGSNPANINRLQSHTGKKI